MMARRIHRSADLSKIARAGTPLADLLQASTAKAREELKSQGFDLIIYCEGGVSVRMLNPTSETLAVLAQAQEGSKLTTTVTTHAGERTVHTYRIVGAKLS